MGASGEPSGYYPMDSSGVMVQSELPAPCKCPVFTPTALSVCPPLGYGGCEGGRCEETPPTLPPLSPAGFPDKITLDIIPLGAIHGNWCGPGHPKKRVPNPGGGVRPIPPPIDAMDSCCFAHDDCYEQHNCTPACLIISIQCMLCDCSLYKCAMKVDCRRLPNPATCQRAKNLIGLIPLVRPGCCFILAP